MEEQRFKRNDWTLEPVKFERPIVPLILMRE